jgi:hypothetical protein
MQQFVTGVPSGLEDDGAMFRFNVGNVTGGFMHRPIDTPTAGPLHLRLSGPSITTWKAGWRLSNTALATANR